VIRAHRQVLEKELRWKRCDRRELRLMRMSVQDSGAQRDVKVRLTIGNRNLECAQQSTHQLIDTDEVGYVYKPLPAKSFFGSAVGGRVDSVLDGELPCEALRDLLLGAQIVR
jgi:hypothetical protein